MDEKTFELNGKIYRPEMEGNECDGCVGVGNTALCQSLPRCHDVIFVEVIPD